MGSMSYRGKDRDGREVWELQLSLGYEPDTQSYAKYTERIHGPKTSARRRLRDLERDQDDGKLKAASSQTLGEYLTLWLEGLDARNLARHTCQEYRATAKRYLIPRLGYLRLRAVSAEDIDAMLAKLARDGLSPATLLKVKTVLSSALTQARKRGYIATNPAHDAITPKLRRADMVTLSEQATDELLSALSGDPFYQCLFLVAVTTGMRRGELCALRESDVDLAEATLSVQRGADVGAEGVVMSDPKSPSARRTIRLHERTVQALATHSLLLDDYRRRFKDRWQENALVFPSVRHWVHKGRELPPGRLLLPHSITQRWDQVRKDGLVPEKMRFHDLRHTHATQLLRAGVNVKVVSERLGHANVSITLNTYAHVLPDMQQSAVDALDWLSSRQ